MIYVYIYIYIYRDVCLYVSIYIYITRLCARAENVSLIGVSKIYKPPAQAIWYIPMPLHPCADPRVNLRLPEATRAQLVPVTSMHHMPCIGKDLNGFDVQRPVHVGPRGPVSTWISPLRFSGGPSSQVCHVVQSSCSHSLRTKDTLLVHTALKLRQLVAKALKAGLKEEKPRVASEEPRSL